MVFFALSGIAMAALRVHIGRRLIDERELEKIDMHRKLMPLPLTQFAMVLFLASFCLPANPWRHMTSTVLYDAATALASNPSQTPTAGSRIENGTNPLGILNYNPSNDPYYVSNLDQPIDPFIASALEGTYFQNIVHIILESMRPDSFPYQEGGILDEHIKKFYTPVSPINQNTITPFMESIATNLIVWDTMFSTIPYTLKALLSRI